MVQLDDNAKRELGYNASRFLQMVSEIGGVETARHLLRAPSVSDGFTTLWERRRLDLSVEAHVLRSEFEPLFPFMKWGHFIRFDPADIDAWVDRARVPDGSRRPS